MNDYTASISEDQTDKTNRPGKWKPLTQEEIHLRINRVKYRCY